MSTVRFHSCMKPSVSSDNLEKSPTMSLSQTNRGSQCPMTPPVLQLIRDVLQVDPDSVLLTHGPSWHSPENRVRNQEKSAVLYRFVPSILSKDLI